MHSQTALSLRLDLAKADLYLRLIRTRAHTRTRSPAQTTPTQTQHKDSETERWTKRDRESILSFCEGNKRNAHHQTGAPLLANKISGKGGPYYPANDLSFGAAGFMPHLWLPAGIDSSACKMSGLYPEAMYIALAVIWTCLVFMYLRETFCTRSTLKAAPDRRLKMEVLACEVDVTDEVICLAARRVVRFLFWGRVFLQSQTNRKKEVFLCFPNGHWDSG